MQSSSAARMAYSSQWKSFVAMGVMLGVFYLNFFIMVIGVSRLPSPTAFLVLVLWLSLAALPAQYESPIGTKFARFVIEHSTKYFPMKLIMEDKSAFDPKESYVIAAEPHSVFPLGILVFTHQFGEFPVPKVRALASKAIFWSPFAKHIWTWLGSAPVTKESFLGLLRKGISCVVIPGGVQECLHMERDREVIFLKQRYGFVKVAMEAGSPLVPTFCFGQSDAYKWWRPTGRWYTQFSRTIGFSPMLYWGALGPVPFPNPMYYVVGKPIPVTKNVNPSREEVAVVHGQFIQALEALFEKYKVELGFGRTSLLIK